MQNEIQEFYNKWCYPNFDGNLNKIINLGARDSSDPNTHWDLFWPNRKKNDKINVLVAGCGTIQAALIAAKNKNAHVTGIDISKESLNIQKQHSKNLSNIELIETSILDYNTSNLYDLIVCTGVLHHLEDPVKNINHLSKMLTNNGVMSIMLYNEAGRHGVYQIQKLAKILKLEKNLTGAKKLANIIENLPKDHSIQKYLNSASELDHLENFMDTFFNPYDRPYSILDVKDLISKSNLEFYSWLEMDFNFNNLNVDDEFERAYCDDLINESRKKISFILTKLDNLAKIKYRKKHEKNI